MNTIEIAARNSTVTIDSSALERLAQALRGELRFPGSAAYERSRRIWNAMIDRQPALIVHCLGAVDVVAAVNFGREHDLLAAVRGGGHNVAGNAVCEGGLMIDLTGMRHVHADPLRRVARAAGGATWGDFDAETQLFGLATPGGLISDTGVAGLTLGGGIGWLTRSHGLACDNLVSVDVVTSEGTRVRASAEDNADLFWGLKGGGGNFGVATSFEFQLHPAGPLLFGGMTAYPLEGAGRIFSEFRDFVMSAPEELGLMAGLTTLPDGQAVLTLIGVYNGDLAAGEAAVKPLRSLGPVHADTFGPTPYRTIQTMFDRGSPPGLRYYWKSSFLDSAPDEALATLIAQAQERPSQKSKIFLECLGGAFERVPGDAAVFDHRTSRFNLLIIGAWEEPTQDDVNRAWARDTWQAAEPWTSDRVYVNYLGTESDEGDNRIRDAYGPGKYDRLVVLKTRYDPTNFFRMNQNIEPAES